MTPETCPQRQFHGNPFRYCGVEGCGWIEPAAAPPVTAGREQDARETLRALSDVATGGPWAVDSSHQVVIEADPGSVVVRGFDDVSGQIDAAFIAAAVNYVRVALLPSPPATTPCPTCGGARSVNDKGEWSCYGECGGYGTLASPPATDGDAAADPRVHVDEYVVYPTGYDDMAHSDKDAWCLTVRNGHAWGWSIRRGRGMSSSMAMNRKGRWIVESRGSGNNKPRRWPLNEALRIALAHVDTIRLNGCTAGEASAEVAARLAALPAAPVGDSETGTP